MRIRTRDLPLKKCAVTETPKGYCVIYRERYNLYCFEPQYIKDLGNVRRYFYGRSKILMHERPQILRIVGIMDDMSLESFADVFPEEFI